MGSTQRVWVFAVAMGVAVGMLVAGLLVPLAAGYRFTKAGESTDTLAAAGDPGAPAPLAELDSSAQPGALLPSGGAAAPDASGAPGAASGAAAPQGGSAGAGTSTGGGAAAPAAGAAGGGGGGGRLTASDRGVTPTVVKVGMLLLDVGPIGRAGVNIAVDPEQQQQAWTAYVNDVNSRGGLSGRKIEPHFATYDVLSPDSQRAACLNLTQDKKVFVVLGGFPNSPAVLCVTGENGTPLLSNISNTPDSVSRRSQGRLMTIFPRASRMMANFVAELDRTGELKGKRIGILSDDSSDPGDEVAPMLVAALKRSGHNFVYRGVLSGSTSSQTGVEVQQMRSKNVDAVLLLAGTINSQSFVQGADRQQYRPRYFVSDWSQLYGDTTVQNMPASFAGAIGVTITRNNEYRNRGPEPAVAAACRKTYEAKSGRKLAPRGEPENSLTMNYCDLMRIFETSAKAAGPNLTRAGLSAAMQGVGRITMGGFGDGSLRPQKLDAGDFVRRQKWDGGCKCWAYVDAFHAGRF